MADFSKQYCEINSMGFDGDFDIIEEWNKLEPDHAVPFVCEGFGFTWIAKLEKDLSQPFLGIVDFNFPERPPEWVTLDELIDEYNNKI